VASSEKGKKEEKVGFVNRFWKICEVIAFLY
jgi:hypothetical protein